MSDQPEPQVLTVNITWPPDACVDAEPVDAFVFTDIGENVGFAFGLVPPPPGHAGGTATPRKDNR